VLSPPQVLEIGYVDFRLDLTCRDRTRPGRKRAPRDVPCRVMKEVKIEPAGLKPPRRD